MNRLQNDYVEHRKRVSQIEKQLILEPTSLNEILTNKKILASIKQTNDSSFITSDSYPIGNTQSEIYNLKNNFDINTESAKRMVMFCHSHYCQIPTASFA